MSKNEINYINQKFLESVSDVLKLLLISLWFMLIMKLAE